MLHQASESTPTRESIDDIRVPKWPFWLADALLIIFAFMVFAQAGEPPSSVSLLISVCAVTLGALAFVTPYLFELLLRYRFLLDRFDDNSSLEPVFERLQQFQSAAELAHTKIKNSLAKTNAQNETLQQQLSTCQTHLESLAERLPQLEDLPQTAETITVNEQPSTEAPPPDNPEPSPPPAIVAEDPPADAQNDKAPDTPEPPPPPTIVAEDPPAEARSDKAPDNPEPSPPPAIVTEDRPADAQNDIKPDTGSGLLNRAMRQGNGSGDTPAVKRIIGRTFSPKPPMDAASDAREPAAEITIPEAEQSPPLAKSNEAPASATAAEDAPLFPEMPLSPRRGGKPKSSETVVLARVLIGIGNKPYIRGDLPGLHPERGVAMDFREIGLWQWVSSSIETPGKIRIYRNDEDPEKAAAHTIEPGQHLEVKPRFS